MRQIFGWTGLVLLGLLVPDGESQAGLGQRAAPRAIEYAQSSRTAAAIKLLPEKNANLYPIQAQSAAVERMATRLQGNPLVVQGVDLLPQGGAAAIRAGTIERFMIQGKLSYELEISVVRRGGVELTPQLRRSVEEALQRVSGEAASIRQVTVDLRTIEVQTDAGIRSLLLRLDNSTSRDAPAQGDTQLADLGGGPT